MVKETNDEIILEVFGKLGYNYPGKIWGTFIKSKRRSGGGPFEKCEFADMGDPVGNQRGGAAGGVHLAGCVASRSVCSGKLGCDCGNCRRRCVRDGRIANLPESNGTNDKR